MKKIGALLSAFAILTLSILSLFSCGNGSEVPENMRLVAGGESLGYYFYAPEEWTVSNVGEIKSAYASRVDTSSVSFAEVGPFENVGVPADDYFFNSYFKQSLLEYPKAPTVSNPEGEEILFGKEGEAADRAKKYTFTLEYFDYTANRTFKYAYMQILIKKADSYYIFQYCASLENRNGTSTTYYDYYLGDAENEGKITKVIKEFRFVNKVGEDVRSEVVTDSDGFTLVSDSALCGFDLYVPSGFKADFSSAIVSASHTDGSNITMTKTPGYNENVNQYMLRRFGELESTVTNIEYELKYDENGEPVYDPQGKQVVNYETIKFGDAEAANVYKYSYVYNGTKFQIYQVIVIDGWVLSYQGYVFTYTATEANYSLHLEDVLKTIEKVNFK